MAKNAIRFSIYLNGKLIDEVDVDRPVFNVGKLSTSTLRLDDVNVSRKHAVIERREDGRWRITDLGSTNGTLLRGERIEQAELHDGDRLQIGRTTLVVHLAETAPPTTAAAYTAPTTESGTAGDPEAPSRAPAPRLPRPARTLEPWATSRPPAVTPTRWQLPRGSIGHILTMLGALIFLAGSVLMPWQRFELASLTLAATDVNVLGLLMTLVGGSTLAASAWGFVTGRRHAAARYNLIAALAVVAWMGVALASTSWGSHVMQYETVSLGLGFVVAAWGALLMLGGVGTTFGALPRWDESTSFLRLLVSREDQPLQDVVVYEPRTIELLPELPRFRVTREGDTFVQRQGQRWTPIAPGARGSIEADGARVLYLFVKPLGGRGTVALTSWSESAAFGLLAVLVALTAGLYSIVGWDAEGKRLLPDTATKIASIEPVITEDKPPEEKVVVQVELEQKQVEPEIAVDDERIGDDEAEEPQVADADEEDVRQPSELVDRLNPQREEPIDLSKLSPTERQEKARELAQNTALAQAFNSDNPLFAEVMQLDTDVDSRVAVLAALDGPGTTFMAGSVDPFGGTLSGPGGFPGGPEAGGMPPGGPDGGPVVAGAFGKDHGPKNLQDIGFTERPIKVVITEPPARVSGGGLDASTVQQYIRRYLNGIRACYQERLQGNRKLGGKVILAFTILPSGTVMDAHTQGSTLGDSELEGCIATKMSRWKFPSPKDGGVVEVAYPLILKTQ